MTADRQTQPETAAAADLTVLSLGAGVQSSTLLLMACAGELPRPDVAVFADTGWEPSAVYRWLHDVCQPAADTADTADIARIGWVRHVFPLLGQLGVPPMRLTAALTDLDQPERRVSGT